MLKSVREQDGHVALLESLEPRILLSAGDLTVSEVLAPSAIGLAETFRLSWTVRNAGSETASAPYGYWFDAFAFSTDPQWGEDRSLGYEYWWSSLSAGGTYTFTVDLQLPPDLPVGAGYLLVKADAGNYAPEADEANNVFAHPVNVLQPDVDLQVTATSAPGVAGLGEMIDISWTVTNTGSEAAVAEWYDSVYLSADPALGADDVELIWEAAGWASPLPGGGSYQTTTQAWIPNTAPTGAVYLLFAADTRRGGGGGEEMGDPEAFTGVQPETNEDNNVTARAITLTSPDVDLELAGADAPTDLHAGGTAVVGWTVRNTGSEAATAEYRSDNVYFSSDAVWDKWDTWLAGESFYEEPVVAGGSYTVGDVVLPLSDRLPPGPGWLIFVTDAYGEQPETDKGDNQLAVPVTVHPPDVDLEITSISAPSVGNPGQTVNLSWTVRNNGGQQTTRTYWYDYVYLSTDDVWDENDTYIAARTRSGALGAGASYTLSSSVGRIPSATPAGAHYLLFVTDDGNLQPESDETNNVYAHPIAISPSNLSISSVTAVPEAGPGDSVTLEWTVANSGSGGSGSRYDAVYLASDPSLGGDALELLRTYSTTVIAPGAAETLTRTITLPEPLPGNGSMHFVFVTDVTDVVHETDESDNLASAPVTILGADLHAATAAVAGSTLTPGATVQVSFTVRNEGNQAAEGGLWTHGYGWYDGWYLSDDPVWDGNDQILRQRWVGSDAPLAAGAHYDVTDSFVLPVSATPGERYLLLVTDSTHLQPEAGSQPNVFPVPILTEGPDLVLMSASAPTDIVASDTIEVSWEVANSGAITAAAEWFDSVYLSTDDQLGWGDTRLGYVLQSAHRPLAPGAQYSTQLNVTVPQAAPGTYYLLFAADRFSSSDSGNQGEQDETNNVLAVPVTLAAPNLAVTAVTAPPAAVVNEVVTVSWTVTNAGSVPGPADWADAVYLSSDPVWSAGDVRLATVSAASRTPLGAGEEYTATFDLVLPAVSPGERYLLFVADADRQQGETDEEDNVLAVPISILAPDLVVSAPTAPAEAALGESVAVSWTVTNNSVSPAAGSWHDAVYLSLDPDWDPSDTLAHVESAAAQAPLASGEGYTVSTSVAIPDFALGAVWLLFVVNHAAEQGEADRANNVVALPIALTGPDLSVTAAVAPDAAVVNDTISVSWTVENLGESAAAFPWYDGVFLSSDPFLDVFDAHLLSVSQSDRAPLESTGAYSLTRDVLLPADRIGSFFLLFATDRHRQYWGDDLLTESSEGNNVLSLPITITAPDLEMTGATVPGTIVMGEPTTVQFTVTNVGAVPAFADWPDAVLLSDDPFPDYQDKTLASRTVSVESPLGAGDSYTVSLDVTVRTLHAAPGQTKYLILLANRGAAQGEVDSSNNYLVFPVSLVAPDLVVTGVTAPPTAVIGQEMDVTWSTGNPSGYVAAAGWHDGVHLSDRPDLTGTRRGMGAAAAPAPLVPGSDYAQTLRVTIPDFAPGSQYLVLRTDEFGDQPETDEANNLLAVPILLTAANLGVTDLAVTPSSGMQSGDAVTVRWRVVNTGSGATPKGFSDRVTVLNRQTGEVLVATRTYYDPQAYGNAPIAPGGHVDRSITLQLPEGPAAVGDLEFLVETDADAAIIEYSGTSRAEDDNSVSLVQPCVLAPYPDLTVTSVIVPANVLSGESAAITWTVTNLGDRATGSARDGTVGWRDRIYLTDTPTPAPGALFGSFLFGGSLEPGASVTRTQSIHFPIDWSGEVYVVVQTDAWDGYFEHDEANNLAAGPNALTVTLAPMPNLQVTAVTPPTNPLSGQPTQIEWVVTNAGTASTGAEDWRDYVYLSHDAVLDPTDRLLGSVLNPSYLDVGESHANSLTATLPVSAEGLMYLIVHTDAGEWVYEHEQEEDNLLAAPVNVVMSPTGDLQVVSVTAPTVGASGEDITVSWTVRNEGTGLTTAAYWHDGVFLSADDTYDPGDRQLGAIYRRSPLAPGEEYTASASLALPANLSGTFYVIVVADLYNRSYEHGAEGNNATPAPSPLQVLLLSPDLEVPLVSTAPTVQAGALLRVNYQVHNAGTANADAWYWYDTIWLSEDDEWQPDDILLSRERYTSGLAMGATANVVRDARIPHDIEGDYYVLAYTDSDNSLWELDNYNNVGATAHPVTIVYTPPDLVVSGANAPASILSGALLSASFTVENRGEGPTPAPGWIDGVYLSSDPVWDPLSDIPLATVLRGEPAPLGGAYTVSVSGQVPWSLDGDYFLLFVTDAKDQVHEGQAGESNNVLPLPLRVDFVPADLVVTSVSAARTAGSGGTLAVSWTVTNVGGGVTSTGQWHDSVVLRDIPVPGTGTVLGSVPHVQRLLPGESYTVTTMLPVPDDLAGTFYVCVHTDSAQRVLEGAGESNNATVDPLATVIILSPVADLEASNVTAPATGYTGQNLTVSWEVRNLAAPIDSGHWYDAVFLSADPYLDPDSDVFLGFTRQAAPLSTGGGYLMTEAFFVPEGLEGLWYVGVYTDARSPSTSPRIDERGAEDNNRAMSPQPVLLTLAPPADLIAGTLTIPVTAAPGEEVTLTYTVSNEGVYPAEGRWYDSLYLSSDDEWSINDPLLGHVLVHGPLPVGESYTGSLTAALPGVLPGDYHVLVRSDIRNHVRESDEANNFAASLDTAYLSPDELAMGSTVTGVLSTGQSAYYSLAVPPGQTLELDLHRGGDAVTEMYLRHGLPPSRGAFDLLSEHPYQASQRIVVPFTESGTYYVLIHQRSGGDSVGYELTARALEFEVTAASPQQVGNAGRSTLTIEGAQFTDAIAWELVGATGETRSAASFLLADSTRAYVTFDLTGAAVGDYVLRATHPDGRVIDHAEPVTVVPGTGGQLEVFVDMPPWVRPQAFTVGIEYANTGDSDLVAPLLELQGPDAIEMGLAYGRVDAVGTMRVIGYSPTGPAGVLRPGQRERITVFCRPLEEGGYSFTLRSMVVGDDRGDSDMVDWVGIGSSSMAPAGDATLWSALLAVQAADMGATWDELLTSLAQRVTQRPLLGGRPNVLVDDLLSDALSDAAFRGGGNFDAQPPSVLTHFVPPGPGGVHSIAVVFSESIDTATFDAADLVLLAPDGTTVSGLSVEPVYERFVWVRFPIQSAPGRYRLSIGPEIRDRVGLPLDQDFDGVGGEAGEDVYTAAFEIGPDGRLRESLFVADHAPSGTIPQREGAQSVYLTFSTSLDSRTFTPTDVAIAGPAGLIRAAAVERCSPTLYRVDFPRQRAIGEYTIILGPNVQTLDGLALDQDGDGTGGTAGDAYHGAFRVADLSGPRVVSHTPDWLVTEPVLALDVSFNEPILASMFTLDQVRITTEAGSVAPLAITWLSDIQCRITLDALRTPGDVTVTIGPGVRDLHGNAMDQNGDGVNGGADDAYSWTFQIPYAVSLMPAPASGRIEPLPGEGEGTGMATLGPPAQNCHAVTIIGNVRYEGSPGYSFPDGARVTVQLWETDGDRDTRPGETTELEDDLIAVTRTNTAGQFVFIYDLHGEPIYSIDRADRNRGGDDPSLPDGTRPPARYYVVLLADNDHAMVLDENSVVVVDPVVADNPWMADISPSRTAAGHAPTTWARIHSAPQGMSPELIMPPPTPGVRVDTHYEYMPDLVITDDAFQPAEWVYWAAEYIARDGLSGRGKIGIAAPCTDPNLVAPDSAAYSSALDLILLGPALLPMSGPAILHEYGHALHEAAVGFTGFPYTGKVPYGMIQETPAMDTAFAEAWASFFASWMTEQWESEMLRKMRGDRIDQNRLAKWLEDNSYWMGFDAYGYADNARANDGAIHSGQLARQFDGVNRNANDDGGTRTYTMGGFMSIFWDLADGLNDDGVEGFSAVWDSFRRTAILGDMWGFHLDYALHRPNQMRAIANVFIDHGLEVYDDPETREFGFVDLGALRGITGFAGMVVSEYAPGQADEFWFDVPSLGASDDRRYDVEVILSFNDYYGDLDLRLEVTGPEGTRTYDRLERDGGRANIRVGDLPCADDYHFIAYVYGHGGLMVEGGVDAHYGGDYHPDYQITLLVTSPRSSHTGWDWPDDDDDEDHKKRRWRHEFRVFTPVDPNDILGPEGYGDENWIGADAPLDYTIRFENEPGATAWAREVRITQQLDPDLDWRSFRVGDFGWADIHVDVPANRPFYSGRLDLRDTLGVYVDIVAGLDYATGEAFWHLRALDPATGELPESVFAGLLAPEDGTGVGQGLVTYTVRPLRTTTGGTVIDSLATIVFDTELPIDTPPIAHTLDPDAPVSTVHALPEASEPGGFVVSWSADDAPGGSGLASVTVYVSEQDGPYRPWLTATTQTEAVFIGEPGRRYAFYSLAADNVGNAESAPTAPHAASRVGGPPSGRSAARNDGDPRPGWKDFHSLSFTFTDALTAIDADALALLHADTREPCPVLWADFTYDPDTRTARWAGPDRLPPAGRYLAQLSASAIRGADGEMLDGNADGTPGDAYELPLLLTLSGDADSDGRVDLLDLSILGTFYGQSGRTWAQGDFTGDGRVDLNDLTVLGTYYGSSLDAIGDLSVAADDTGASCYCMGTGEPEMEALAASAVEPLAPEEAMVALDRDPAPTLPTSSFRPSPASILPADGPTAPDHGLPLSSPLPADGKAKRRVVPACAWSAARLPSTPRRAAPALPAGAGHPLQPPVFSPPPRRWIPTESPTTKPRRGPGEIPFEGSVGLPGDPCGLRVEWESASHRLEPLLPRFGDPLLTVDLLSLSDGAGVIV